MANFIPDSRVRASAPKCPALLLKLTEPLFSNIINRKLRIIYSIQPIIY